MNMTYSSCGEVLYLTDLLRVGDVLEAVHEDVRVRDPPRQRPELHHRYEPRQVQYLKDVGRFVIPSCRLLLFLSVLSEFDRRAPRAWGTCR